MLQDIINPNNKNNISTDSSDNRNKRQTLRERLSSINKIEEEIHVPVHFEGNEEEILPYKKKKTKKFWLIPIFILLLAVIVLIFYTTIGSRAEISLKMRQVSIKADGVFNAVPSFDEEKPGSVVYKTITVSDSESEIVKATAGPSIQKKAVGSFVLYNYYSTSPQTIIASTRIETPDGRIYRINNKTIIPGKTIKAGIDIPGKITVKATADGAGEKYNIKTEDNVSTSTIPGFTKGTPKFEKIVALPIEFTGGFTGTNPIISNEISSTTKNILFKKLTDKLIEETNKNLPDGYVWFNDIKNITFSNPEIVMNSTSSAKMTIKASMKSAIFLKNDLVKLWGPKEITLFSPGGFEIQGFEKLTYMPVPQNKPVLSEGSSFRFSFKGDLDLLGIIDKTSLIQSLLGTKKDNALSVLKDMPEIEGASFNLYPRWKKTFPKDIKSIRINTES